jgi:hypothetical protein
MHIAFSKRRPVLLGGAILSVTMLGIVGCSSNDDGGANSSDDGHAIGWRDTPVATKAPPVAVPNGTPVGEDGTTSYAQPSNPLPPGGLPPQPAPAQQPNANNNTGP